MKHIIAALTLVAFTGIGFAQGNPAGAAAPAAVSSAAKHSHHGKMHFGNKREVTMGSISAIDAAAKTITVKNGKGDEKTFKVESLGTLTQGEKVKVMVKKGKTIVKEIKEHGKQAAKAEPAAQSAVK